MDEHALNELDKKLTARNAEGEFLERHQLREEGSKAPAAWAAGEPTHRASFLGRMTPIEFIFAGSIIFFIVAASAASLLFFSGSNTVSTKNVQLEVSGPSEIRAGDSVTLTIVVTNKNAVPMELADLIVEFPSGTRSEADVSVDLPRIRESLGTIQPGETVNRTVKAVLFGRAQTEARTKVTVEYRVQSSNAVFYSESEYAATITQSPAQITVKALSEVVSGQETEIEITVSSNASENLTGMLLVVDYPPGFVFSEASPQPVSGTSVYALGDIETKGKRVVIIRGTFHGEDGDDRVLHITSGTKVKGGENAISAPLAAEDIELTVRKPFVSADILIDDEVVSEIVIARGEVVTAQVRWTNNLPIDVYDVEITMSLNGVILDRSKIRAGRGFYRSGDTTILFTKDTDPRLAIVGPGESATSEFQFAALPPGVGTYKNPQIDIKASVRARRLTEESVPEEITTSASLLATIATDVSLASSITRSGNFTVTGPLPPRVDMRTDYIVVWTVTNSANSIANAVVTGMLPLYVAWSGQTSGTASYNPVGRTVTWTIGDMAAGETRTESFVVGVTPSLEHDKKTPVIIGSQRITAFDRFVLEQIERTAPEINTSTGFGPIQGTVVP